MKLTRRAAELIDDKNFLCELLAKPKFFHLRVDSVAGLNVNNIRWYIENRSRFTIIFSHIK